ncbi:MAG: C39 family peptidase [Candidatus Moraniibacteriota bacterium]
MQTNNSARGGSASGGKKIFFLLIISVFLISSKEFASGSSCDDTCESKCIAQFPSDDGGKKKCKNDCVDDCESLEKKAKVYEDLIKLKNKQQDALAGQLDNIDNEQAKTLAQLQETQKKVQTLAQQVDDLSGEIKEGEFKVDFQRKILAGLMQSYYEYDQQGVLPLVLAGKAFSEAINQLDYIEQSGDKVSRLLLEIKQTRQKLVDNQNSLIQKKEESDKAKETLIDKKENLQATENQKTNLLFQTQGEEAKYKQLLARVEAQKQELLDFSAASNLGDVSSSVSSYPKPSTNLASTSWYFSQKDSRWGDKKIGNSKTLMKSYGCAVTAVSMVFREKGASINPGAMASQKIFYYDLIKWPATWSPDIKLVSSNSHGNVKWATIDSEIKKGNPVIVYIKRSRGGGHYVVITGKDSKDYIVHDPYFGANLYLNTSKSLVGKLGVDSGVSIDQMIIYN